MTGRPGASVHAISGAVGAAALAVGLGLAATGLVTMWRTDLGVSKAEGLLLAFAGLSLLAALLVAAAWTSAGRRLPGGHDPVVAVLERRMNQTPAIRAPPSPARVVGARRGNAFG